MSGYDAAFDPPAPVALVEVTGPSGTRADVRMLLDSGADGSIIPRHVAEAVGASLQRTGYELEFYDGARLAADETSVEVRLAPYRFAGRYLVQDQVYGVLGRNVLRHVVLRLDGPAQEWTIARRGS